MEMSLKEHCGLVFNLVIQSHIYCLCQIMADNMPMYLSACLLFRLFRVPYLGAGNNQKVVHVHIHTLTHTEEMMSK